MTRNSKSTSDGRLDEYPQLEENMTNKEYVKTCRMVSALLKRRCLAAKRRCENLAIADPARVELSEEFTDRAREFYLFNKMAQVFTQCLIAEASLKKLALPPADPKDVN